MSTAGLGNAGLRPPDPLRRLGLPGNARPGRRFGEAPTVRIRRTQGIDLNVTVVIDDSGSTAFTDPSDHRYLAARRIVRALARSGGWSHYLRVRRHPRLSALDRAVIRNRAWAADRLAVISFTETVTRSVPLTLLPEGLDVVEAVLAGPGPSGGTRLVPALRAAAAIARDPAARRGERPRHDVVLVFTDGEVFDDPDELQAAVTELGGILVHLVLLGGGGGTTAALAASGLLTVSTVASLTEPADLERCFAEAVQRAATDRPTEPRPDEPVPLVRSNASKGLNSKTSSCCG